MNALAISPTGDHAVVAGREVLMILNVTSDSIVQTLNMRAGVKTTQNHSSNDVKWAGSYASATIATAAINSGVVIWDIAKASKDKLDRVLSEHSRAVNRICFHPTQPLLLTASQDGKVKLWDFAKSNHQPITFDGRAESVRDVQFNPADPLYFMAAYENGSIRMWDIRRPSLPIWEINGDVRKPAYTIQTIAPTARLGWRPGFSDQIASCALSSDYRIHVWDINNPFIPMCSFDEHSNITTGFLWKDSNTLWSCSKDRSFVVQDIHHAYKQSHLLTPSAQSWNVFGHMAFAAACF
eukprot:jgi/Hompol1/5096/HPOL_000492-RA